MPKIKKIEITNFRSIADSDPIEIQPNVTALVGPNEAGKTSVLESLRFFGKEGNIDTDDICDYEDTPSKDEEPVIRIHMSGVKPSSFTVGGSPRRSSDGIYGIDKEIEVVLEKYADGRYDIHSEDIENELNRYESTKEDRFEAVNSQLSTLSNKIQDQIDEDEVEENDELQSDLGRLKSSRRAIGNSLGHLKSRLEQAEEIMHKHSSVRTPRIRHEVQEIGKKLDSLQPIAKVFSDESFSYYFLQDTELIQSSMEIEEVIKSNSNPYSELLDFVGISPTEIPETDTRKRRKKVQNRMEVFSERFEESWDQGDIEFKLDLANDEVHLLVTDNSAEEQYVEQRSLGFRYFLTFFIRLIANSDGDEIRDELILLDDPGIHLHPERQKDLLNALESLAEQNQIIYTTHSPYMIESSHLNRVRIVTSHNGYQGTEIKADFSEASTIDEDSLEPVRGALGATFSDSLFTTGRTLLVEGYTDRVYLDRLSKMFYENGEIRVPHDIGILDMGGDGSWSKYTRLLDSEDYEYALLLDGDGAKQSSKNKIEDSKYINEEQVIFADEVISEEERAVAIEDLFSDTVFSRIVESHYGLDNELEINSSQPKKLADQAKGEIHRLSSQEDLDLKEFNKGAIADSFDQQVENGSLSLEEFDEITKENFSDLLISIKEQFEGRNTEE